MNHISFGSVLKEARISKGYELTNISRRLRIRPDILEAIENSDFERMPPRGYSRNMINAYARFLGLNANDVTRMYLDESYANQIGRAHQNAKEMRYMHQNTSSATSRPGKRQPTNQFRAVSQTRQRMENSDTERRQVFHDEPETDPREAARARAAARMNRNDDLRLHPASRAAIPDGKYVNLYANPSHGMGHAPANKIPFIVGGVVIIAILLFIISSIFSCATKPAEVQNVPVAGVENKQEEIKQVEMPPTDFTLSYEVPEGKAAYLEVIVDGKTVEAGDVVGPASQSFKSAGTIKFVTSGPQNVIVKVDGQEKTLEANARGVATETYSFNEILNKWYADHPDAQRPSNSGSSTSGSNSGSGSGSGDSANNSGSGSNASGGSGSGSSSGSSTSEGSASGSSGSDSSSSKTTATSQG